VYVNDVMKVKTYVCMYVCMYVKSEDVDVCMYACEDHRMS
jgi:hypothetical protein